jgi:hypothetical protein
MRPNVRRLALLAFAVLGAALTASPARAAAVLTQFSFSQTDVFPVSGYFCLPNGVGTGTQTETSTGQIVDTGSGVFTFHGISTYDLHIDFPDGTYVQSGINREHDSFVFDAPLTVSTAASQDFETIYNAHGQPVGRIEIHEVSHVTYADLNGNGQPDAGEVTVQFDRFRLRCA